MSEEKIYQADSSIPKSEFKLVHKDESLHDTKFETRPIGWFEDSLRRFAKNKASVVGAIIIFIILLFSIIVPVTSKKARVNMTGGFKDKNYATVLPRIEAFKGSGFWDGTKKETISEATYKLKMFNDANDDFFDLSTAKLVSEKKIGSQILRSYEVRTDSYAFGTKVIDVTKDEMDKLFAYEKDLGVTYSKENARKSIIKPAVDYNTYIDGELKTWLEERKVSETSIASIQDKLRIAYSNTGYYYYKLVPTANRNGAYSDTQFEPLLVNDKPVDLYRRDSSGKYEFYEKGESTYKLRVDYNMYAEFKYGFSINYIFGANQQGEDIFLRLAIGARFSLALGIGISAINFIIGLIYGAVSGYYGGRADLIMERITDIIANIPVIIIMTIAQIQLTNNVGLKSVLGPAGTIVVAILIAFIYNGWVGVAGTTRMQFYRFKGQEYVLASRTLGAKDRRLIFKHILPNAAGTLVTSSVLMIPGIIFSESSLSYLGIIDFSTSGISSVGVLLNEGQAAGIATSPHVLLFPALLITLLMISFNLFGNGLRDAFNTTLRGSEG